MLHVKFVVPMGDKHHEKTRADLLWPDTKVSSEQSFEVLEEYKWEWLPCIRGKQNCFGNISEYVFLVVVLWALIVKSVISKIWTVCSYLTPKLKGFSCAFGFQRCLSRISSSKVANSECEKCHTTQQTIPWPRSKFPNFYRFSIKWQPCSRNLKLTYINRSDSGVHRNSFTYDHIINGLLENWTSGIRPWHNNDLHNSLTVQTTVICRLNSKWDKVYRCPGAVMSKPEKLSLPIPARWYCTAPQLITFPYFR